MSQNFWLLDLDDTRVSVSLVSSEHSDIIAQSTSVNYLDQESLVKAVDQSLSGAAFKAGLAEDFEPSRAAFILPPTWIGADGRIIPSQLKFIEVLCRSLKLDPMGFIAHDEAVVEGFTDSNDLPPSFILLRLAPSVFDLSLVYLGKIQNCLHQSYTGLFSAALLEKTLSQLNSSSTLPPQIIIFGDVEPETLLDLRNYPWIGRKDIETFLHFPDVRFLSAPEVSSIFAKVISTQLAPSQPVASKSDLVGTKSDLEAEAEPESEVAEVSPSDLGFSSPMPTLTPKFKLTLPPFPKISLPRFSLKLKLPRLFLLLFAASPLLVLGFFLLARAKIALYLTPYEFKNEVDIILDSSATSLDPVGKRIPVVKKTFDVTVTETIATTGQKTVGDKARGELGVFNKSEKVQNLSRGTILTDSGGRKFETVNQIQVASSSADLNRGVITLGQAKVAIIASDIGPEFNLPAGSPLQFQDISSNILITQLKESLTGGSKSQVKAVDPADKSHLETKIVTALKNSTDSNVAQNLIGIPGAIKETLSVKKNRIEYNREVGEEVDELTAQAQSTISVFVLDGSLKSSLVNLVLANQPDFSAAAVNPNDFRLSFQIIKTNDTVATGKLLISGQAQPRIDDDLIRRSVSGKGYRQAADYLKTGIPRLYDFSIKTNYGLFQSFLPLPLRLSNINLQLAPEP